MRSRLLAFAVMLACGSPRGSRSPGTTTTVAPNGWITTITTTRANGVTTTTTTVSPPPRRAPTPLPEAPPDATKLVSYSVAHVPNVGVRHLVIYGGDTTSIMPACRCVFGEWRLASNGETSTHFTGTISSPSFNHARSSTKLFAAKIRKTRHLMQGVFGKDRASMHGILRGSGNVMLQEVSGGEWELIGFSTETGFGDLFANNTRWRADPNKPPKAAPASEIADDVIEGATLELQINNYRASLGLPRIPISPAMTKVAKAHAHDLAVNKPVTEGCNMHSWSANGPWTSCCYDKSEAAARCMWAKPKEIAGYKGNGFEIAAMAHGGMEPAYALHQWRRSPPHHAVMVNAEQWTQDWGAMGVAIEGMYAVAWFGEERDGT